MLEEHEQKQIGQVLKLLRSSSVHLQRMIRGSADPGLLEVRATVTASIEQLQAILPHPVMPNPKAPAHSRWKILALVTGSSPEPYRIGLTEEGKIGCSCRAATVGKYRLNVLEDKHVIDFARRLNGERASRPVEIVGSQEDLDIAGALLRFGGTMAAEGR